MIPACEAKFTIFPLVRLIISLPTYLDMMNGAVRLIAIVLFQSASVRSSASSSSTTPALLTSMSIFPNCRMLSFTTFCTLSALVMS